MKAVGIRELKNRSAELALQRLVDTGSLAIGLPQDPEACRAPRLRVAADTQALLDEERSER